MRHTEAVIFDWAGTTVDYGCMAPIHAMREAFSKYGLMITLDEIRKPMGLLKLDHIKAILNMERVKFDFDKTYNRPVALEDVETIYQHFEKSIFSILHQHTKVINGVLDVQDYLRSQNIKIGSTTGYTKEMMVVVASSAKDQGYFPDYIISADQVRHARPYPYMVYQNIISLKVQDIRKVLKVGDTVVDILEGKHAGCRVVGVVKGSSMLGLDEEEVAIMDKIELQRQVKRVKYQMLSAGADFVIDSIDELPAIIELIS